jgi:lipoyl(octanoyl) transferase
VGTDLDYFRLIVPCGIEGRGVTSLDRLLGRKVARQDVESRIMARFCEHFGRTPAPASTSTVANK